jgi:bacterial/archaeal transporter family protein
MTATVLLLISTVLWGFWGIADKFAVTRAHPYSVQFYYSIPYLLFIPLWYFLSRRSEISGVVDPQAILWSMAASVSSILAVLLFVFALRDKPASIAVAITSIYPIVTLTLALITKSETLSFTKVFGILLIITGVFITQR